MPPKPHVSIIIVCYNMPREISRTVQSLSPNYQKDVSLEDYEIILIDNGSTEHFDLDICKNFSPNIRFFRVDNPNKSPARAINEGLELSEGRLVGVMIDGARLASPGLISSAIMASKIHQRPVIASLGFHLGPDVQMKSVSLGYNTHKEDKLLKKIDWPKDGYRLFDISVFAGSSAQGWFANLAESNALFLLKGMWDELGGYDESFVTPGGGLVNLDTYRRACSLPDVKLIKLLGEGTFHQVHGGVATNSSTPLWPIFHEEYIEIRGYQYVCPENKAIYIGSVELSILPSIQKSI